MTRIWVMCNVNGLERFSQQAAKTPAPGKCGAGANARPVATLGRRDRPARQIYVRAKLVSICRSVLEGPVRGPRSGMAVSTTEIQIEGLTQFLAFARVPHAGGAVLRKSVITNDGARYRRGSQRFLGCTVGAGRASRPPARCYVGSRSPQAAYLRPRDTRPRRDRSEQFGPP